MNPARDQPVFAVVVVHREHAVGFQAVTGCLQGLLGEQEALEAQRRLSRQEGDRVGQGQQDQVVLAVGALQEGPSVVDVDLNARVVVGAVGVVVAAQFVEAGVDLHRIDVGRTPFEC